MKGSWDEIYMSHVLEHLGYQREVPDVLRQIHRILGPGGVLYVSVPNLTLLCKLFLHEDLGLEDRFDVMRIMFGGQLDEHDFHKTGFNEALLGQYLREAGFDKIERVKEFGIFDDTSSMRVFGNFLSLNVEATK